MCCGTRTNSYAFRFNDEETLAVQCLGCFVKPEQILFFVLVVKNRQKDVAMFDACSMRVKHRLFGKFIYAALVRVPDLKVTFRCSVVLRVSQSRDQAVL